MKTRLVFIIAAIFLLGGCDLIKDAATVTINTDLTTTMEVVSGNTKSADAAAGIVAYNFSKSQDLSLQDNEDIADYIQKIREIDLNSLEVVINGMQETYVINSISLDVTGIGNICTQQNITYTNNSFIPSVTAEKLEQVAKKLNDDKKITLTVYGNTNAPMGFTVTVIFESKIVAGALD